MRKISEENRAQLLALCENVKFLRKRDGLSKQEMARKLRISIRSLSMLEKGIIPERLSCDLLINIYFAFGISPTDILKGHISNHTKK